MVEHTPPLRPVRWSARIIQRRQLVRIFAAGLVASLLGQPAAAQQGETLPLKLAVVLGSSVTWDANLFRLASSVDPQVVLGKPSKSDRVSATYVGLRIDKSFAQQRFQLDVTETANRYGSFTFLDFDAFDYRAAWLWRLTPRVSGAININHRQTLASFTDYRGFQRNVVDTDSRSANLDAVIVGGWHLLLGAINDESRYSVVFLPQTSSRTTGAEAGLRYAASSGSSITAMQRVRNGTTLNARVDPVNLIDNGFRLQESELQSTWVLSGKSTATTRLTWVARRHEHFPQRDFSGLAGQFDYSYTPAGKLQLNLSARRDVVAWWETLASYYVGNTLSIAPTWQVDSRNTLRMRLSCTDRDFRGPIVAIPATLREEHLCTAGFGGDWTPRRYITLSANLQRDRRTSNNAAFEFGDTLVVISASLAF